MPPAGQVRQVADAATGQTGGRLVRWFTPILWVNAMLQVLIIVSGGVVRLTGSGLGCPTWPQCVPGSYTPVPHQEQGFHKYIEFGNRTLTGVLGIAAVLAVIAVWRVAPRRHLKVASLAVLAGIAFQAILGGITVRMGLHPATVAAHFLVSAGLVATAYYLYFTRFEPDGPRRLVVPRLIQQVALLACAVAGVVLLLGTVVTGSGPHSGDAETPARFGFDPRTISWLHADAVMLFVGLVVAVWVAVRLTQSDDSHAASAWGAVLLVTLAQGVVGYTQYLTGLPWLLVLVHMLLAALLVVAMTRAMVALRRATPAD
jgi:cytochrome c oxidase assembly protein subunit 15